ncbi:MAG TPA: LLM class F420-dependent oxidoreductase [Nocardioides sp.]|mgnify:CR=1 FL=1|uniref:LLM class F420-dependent oxidoreductase n=1 Tax=uncultured Nocardioides sp. TaxID=198441 RepID=UPI000ECD68FD|nr:LLM class F420-dependent oxidoreductase [uncultured Nocardioides sp.]HCB07650.1 LLM class F420-dependent oxidoreductase [Nocardioides sp.]HRD60291.1 LLM class F420-dependent oxidoreductase [Nocardioides sp.]HRI94399.1 LLM class F420-dependent oxidoreductase [Nocardioides sp.]HRK44778.1 LLM class F420-dependent oxidoreductase [Nocardioides sp.]
MQLSYPLQYDGNPRQTADQVAELEKAGLDMVWVAEAYGFDSPTLMGYLAAKTERLQIAAGIINVFSRTPGAILQTVAGLDNVSAGRAVLGLGASGPQVIEGFHGLPYEKPLGRTREVIRLVRSGLKREPLEASGMFTLPLPKDQGLGLGKPLKLLNRPERDNVPIWVASLGDKNVEMTAELADGWLPIFFVPERARQVWGSALDAGAAKRSPELAPLQISAGGMVAIGEGPETKALLDFLRPMFALYVGGMGARGKNFYNELAQQYGFEKEAKEIQDLYLDGKKKEAEALVPMEWLEAANLVGPASYVQERIAAFQEAGVTHLSIVPATDDPAATVRQLKEWVS